MAASAAARAMGREALGNLVPAMTRYSSRSVIPGRQEDRPEDDVRTRGDDASLDRIVFGSRKKPIAPPANDAAYPDPMDMEVDEAGFLVERSDSNRRKGGERRKKDDRRAPDSRRKSDFAPLREEGVAYRTTDDGKRGPILLVGALVIVAVFGVVVWNAYREGVKTDDPAVEAPQLATAGAFKTPPHEVKDASIAGGEPAVVAEQLDGGPAPVVETPPETRGQLAPAPKPAPVQTAEAAPAPVPSKVMAPPPAPLKAPATVMPPPSQAVASKPATPVATTATVVSAPTPKPASPPIDLPKPTAVAPAPAPAAVQTAAFKPAFAAGGSYLVQIAAPSTEASAIAEWDKRAKAMPEFFSAAERFIVQADVNGKTVYRLRAGPFASKADADAFCSAFKAKGGNCFPATK
jgi:hypothetical protein